jgi:predicted neuraminidase
MLRTMFLSLALALPASAQGWLRQNEFIFESAPFPECHASTIVETRDGLLAAWFGGTREKHLDVGIWISRRDGEGWSKPMEVANGLYPDGRRYPCWNPVLFQPREGPLMLFYKVGPSPSSWWGMLMTSEDAGKTWSTARHLDKGTLGPIKNKPVQLENGEILSPSSTEHDGWRVHFERSSDLGKTWKFIGPVNDGKKIGAIQPSILRHRDGRLQAIGRTEQRRVFTTESSDGGLSWSAMRLLALPNPNAGIDALTLADGRHLIVYNHVAKGRTPLNVAVSSDGEKWLAAAVLEREPGEYSYPAVIQTKDGLVHITYTWKRQRVRHVVIDPAKLEPQELRNGEWPTDER